VQPWFARCNRTFAVTVDRALWQNDSSPRRLDAFLCQPVMDQERDTCFHADDVMKVLCKTACSSEVCHSNEQDYMQICVRDQIRTCLFTHLFRRSSLLPSWTQYRKTGRQAAERLSSIHREGLRMYTMCGLREVLVSPLISNLLFLAGNLRSTKLRKLRHSRCLPG
jgi:hypothetical protein